MSEKQNETGRSPLNSSDPGSVPGKKLAHEPEGNTSRGAGSGGEISPSSGSLASSSESCGLPPDYVAHMAAVEAEEAMNWKMRLVSEFHFEEWPGAYEIDYHLLFVEGREIFVSAADVARAATYAARSKFQIGYSTAEILETLDVRDVIEVPGPKVPTHLEGAVNGTYIPVMLLFAILPDRIMGDDINDFCALLNDLEEKRELLEELRMKEKRLRRSRMSAASTKALSLRRLKERDERSLRAKEARKKQREDGAIEPIARAKRLRTKN